MRQISITIYGRVQGVNLRRRIVNVAQDLGLKGYVSKNSNNGLEIIAQGDEKRLQELLTWCQKAYFPAKVSGMNFSWQVPGKPFSKFSLKTDKALIADEADSFYNLSKEILTNEILKLDKENQIPKHVVIIPDGNRRWAKEQGWLPWVGHRKALQQDKIEKILDECLSLGISYLSFWAFSTENWDRDKREVDEIFKLLQKHLESWLDKFQKENIRFRHIGRRDRLPKNLLKLMDDFAEKTKNNTAFNFSLCLDYNGRDDIIRAVNKIISKQVKSIDEKTFADYLDTHDMPNPDLIIRTSGEYRTSGIMAYEAAYSELYFTNVYFPDFDAIQFKRAILDFAARKRNFGGTNKKIHKPNANLFDPDLMDNQSLALKN